MDFKDMMEKIAARAEVEARMTITPREGEPEELIKMLRKAFEIGYITAVNRFFNFNEEDEAPSEETH